jgi:hypothetical protein
MTKLPSGIEVPLNFKPGEGYSPGSGPPIGGFGNMPMSTFFGEDLSDLLPKGIGKRSFGISKYPLSNQANPELDMQMFPDSPVGPGDTVGGQGGVFRQGMPSTEQYFFGTRKSRTRKSRTRKSRTRKSRTRKSRKSRKTRKTRKRKSNKRKKSKRKSKRKSKKSRKK